MLTSANITRCHFIGNKASGDGGAIYVTMKSELNVYDSEFTMNTASSGGSMAVVMSKSLVESCEFASGNASEAGGCIALQAANGTVKQSQFSRCRSNSGGTVAVTDQSTLLLDVVTIKESHSTSDGGALHVSYNSDLSARNSTVTDSGSEYGGGIVCSGRSLLYLESVFISSCSSRSFYSGCVHNYRCNVTMDNITITDASDTYAICADASTINIYNTLAQNDTEKFLWGSFSHASFWNFNMSRKSIGLWDSVAEFRHTLFIRQDETCLIRDVYRSTINLKSVYVTGPKDGIVCEKPDTVVHGNVSGRTLTDMVFNGYE